MKSVVPGGAADDDATIKKGNLVFAQTTFYFLCRPPVEE